MARRRLFAKRHPDANGTTAPAPPAAPPDLPALKQQLVDCRERIRDLAQERESLSLDSLFDTTARARIQAIDKERAELVSLDETLNACIRTVSQQRREQGQEWQGQDWRQRLPNMRRLLRATIGDQWQTAAAGLERAMLDRRNVKDLKAAIDHLDELEHRTAQWVAGQFIELPRTGSYTPGNQQEQTRAHQELQRQQEQRPRIIQQAIEELLAPGTGLRPKRVEEIIVEARKRLAIDIDNAKSHARAFGTGG